MNDEFESWLNTSPIPVIYRQYSDNKDDVLDFLTLLKYPNLYIPNTHVVISLEFLHKILGNKMSKINWCDNLTVNESELHPVTNNVQNQYASLPLTATDSVNTRNKHKWYDVIVAWAEGKEIQFRPMGKSLTICERTKPCLSMTNAPRNATPATGCSTPKALQIS